MQPVGNDLLMNDPLQDPDLPALVAAALERRDRGLETSLEDICADRPDLLEAVRDTVATGLRLPKLQAKAATADPFVGRVLQGRYALEARLGAGAMGVVYRAFDRELGRLVAVKILRATLLGGSEAEQRFLREAEVLAALDHRAVVSIHDRGRTDEQDLFLVMDLIGGQTLSGLLEEVELRGEGPESLDTDWIAESLGVETLPESSYLRLVASWMADLADGLHSAHQKGVFHRDIKPSNILIQRSGRAVLLDFGTAARLGCATITREDAALGTPAYMAPESLASNHKPDPRGDVWGLGATLYHLLTLHQPYRGRPTQVLAALATKDPQPAHRLRPGLPRDFVAILDRAMARVPEQRYASAAAFASDLRAFLEHRPVSARPLRPWIRTWRRARRSPAARAVAGLLAIGGIVALVWGLYVAYQETRRTQYLEAWSHITPNVTVGAPSSRVWEDTARRDALLAHLDEAVRNNPRAISARTLRLGFWLDQGWAGKASDEMDIISGRLASDFAQALAERYRDLLDTYAVAPGVAPASTDALDLSDLPEPKGPADLFLAAYHFGRAGDWDRAKTLLADPSLNEDVAAQELSLRFYVGDPEQLIRRIAWIEDQLGRRTALSAHWLGWALMAQKRYGAAIDVIEDGLALAPESRRLHENAGVVLWRLGEFDGALEHFLEAAAIHPIAVKPAMNVVRVLMDQGRLGEAREALDRVPFEASERGRGRRLSLLAEIQTEQALVKAAEGKRTEAGILAGEAHEAFEALARQGGFKLPARAAIAAAIARDDVDHVLSGLLNLMLDSPADVSRLGVVLNWIPADLDPEDSASLRNYFEELRDYLVANPVAIRAPGAPKTQTQSSNPSEAETGHELPK